MTPRAFISTVTAYSSWIGRSRTPAAGCPYYESYVCGSPRNYSDYCNPEIDRLVEQQSTTADLGRRRQIVLDLQRRLEEDAARPVLGWAKQSILFWPHVRNFVPHVNLHNYHRMQEVWLDR